MLQQILYKTPPLRQFSHNQFQTSAKMACCAGAICCAGTACCNAMCGCCMQCCNTSQQQHTRIGYVLLYILCAGMSIIFLYFGGDMMTPLTTFGYDCSGSDKSVCLGVYTVYRVSFSLLMFHLVIIPFTLAGGAAASIVNGEFQTDGCWLFKICLLGAIFIGTFFIPDGFFDVYKEICRYISIIFLVAQIIIIIDFSYAWNESWISKYESSGSNFWMFWLFFFSGVMWVASIAVIVMNYIWFTEDSGCGLNIFFVTFTIVSGVGFTILSITNFVDNGCKIYLALLTSSAVNLYTTWLCWDGLASDTSSCNVLDAEEATGFSILFGLFITIIMLLYMGFGSQSSERKQLVQEVAQPMLAEGEQYNDVLATNEETDRSAVYFHILMLFVAFYFAMLLTNWGAADIGNGAYQKSEGSMWVMFSAQWTTIVLYYWTLIAPKVCLNRDFNQQINKWTKFTYFIDAKQMVLGVYMQI